MKDIFSTQAQTYTKFRPTYPQELIQYIVSLVDDRLSAWDCGTGNGQLALALSEHFSKVYATDISEKQIREAERRANIDYKIAPAESAPFEDNSLDLVAAAQAVHWFDFEKFYAEVRRTLRPEGVIALMGYSLCRVNMEIDKIIDHFDKHIIHPYWDEERKYIDERYETIPFPFKELPAPSFNARYSWTLEQLVGFLGSWSAVQHFIHQNTENPVDFITDELKNHWGSGIREVTFPIFLRIGRK